jgi:hypothetical protein
MQGKMGSEEIEEVGIEGVERGCELGSWGGICRNEGGGVAKRVCQRHELGDGQTVIVS